MYDERRKLHVNREWGGERGEKEGGRERERGERGRERQARERERENYYFSFYSSNWITKHHLCIIHTTA